MLSAGILVGASALTVGLAVPASAVTIPDWVNGHVPSGSGCSITSLSATPAGDVQISYTDAVTPSVAGWSINGTTSVALLVPGTNNLKFGARVKQNCGGVSDGAQLVLKYVTTGFGSSATSIPVTTPTSANPFDQTFTYTFPGNVGYAGWYQVPTISVVKRYDSFVLNSTNWSYVSSVADTAGLSNVTGSWSTQRVYLLLKTTVTTSASKTTVAAGNSVTFRATLKKAGAVTYDPAVGSLVKFQTKIGTGSWVTRATKTATSAGTVAYTFKPSKTMSWRWVHAGEKTSKFTAPITSTVKKITVS